MHLANHMLVPLTGMDCQRRLRFENEARFVKWRGEGTGNENRPFLDVIFVCLLADAGDRSNLQFL